MRRPRLPDENFRSLGRVPRGETHAGQEVPALVEVLGVRLRIPGRATPAGGLPELQREVRVR